MRTFSQIALKLAAFSLLLSAACTAQPPKGTPAAASSALPSPTAQAPSAVSATATSAENGYSSTPLASSAPHLSYSSVYTGGPYIALTFDDGPSGATTPRLLDILAKRGIKVTFFVLGECVKANPEILKREAAEGHEIANHSWSHPNLARKPEAEVLQQIQQTQNIIFSLIGTKPALLRPPYGSFTDHQKKWARDELGLKVIMWDVDPYDWKKPGANVVAQRIIDGTTPGSIILVHDIHAATVDAMPQTLDALLAKGYRFVTVSQLLAMAKPTPKPTPKPAPAATETPGVTPPAS